MFAQKTARPGRRETYLSLADAEELLTVCEQNGVDFLGADCLDFDGKYMWANERWVFDYDRARGSDEADSADECNTWLDAASN